MSKANHCGDPGQLQVVHVLGSLDVGGAEIRTLSIVEALSGPEMKFAFILLSGREGKLADRARSAGADVVPMPLNLCFPFRFWHFLRSNRVHVVDSHVSTFSGIVLTIARFARVRVRIAHFRSDGDGRSDKYGRRVQRCIMRRLIGWFATSIVGVSPSALEFAFPSAQGRVTRALVLPNGVSDYLGAADACDLKSELNITSHGILMVVVGRPSIGKRRWVAVDVLAEMRRRGIDAHLLILGGAGSDADPLSQAVATGGLVSFVHDRGYVEDVRGLVSQCDFLLMPSLREGLPGVVLEALSVGTPVVSSPLPGSRYIRENVEGVVLVTDPHSIASWALAVDEVLSDWATPQGREAVQDSFAGGPFRLNAVLRRHLQLYRGDRP